MGIFVTPALLMYFFGTAIELPFLNMVLKLCNKVLVPVAVGQVLRATSAKQFFVNNKKAFKSLQEVSEHVNKCSYQNYEGFCIFILQIFHIAGFMNCTVYLDWISVECVL